MLWEVVGRVGSCVELYSRISSVACYNFVLLRAVTSGTGRLTETRISKQSLDMRMLQHLYL